MTGTDSNFIKRKTMKLIYALHTSRKYVAERKLDWKSVWCSPIYRNIECWPTLPFAIIYFFHDKSTKMKNFAVKKISPVEHNHSILKLDDIW